MRIRSPCPNADAASGDEHDRDAAEPGTASTRRLLAVVRTAHRCQYRAPARRLTRPLGNRHYALFLRHDRSVPTQDGTEVAAVLSVGILASQSTESQAWVGAVKALGRAVAAAREGTVTPLNVNVVFQVSGNYTEPEFAGVRTGRYQRSTNHLLVQAAVPASMIADGSRDPDATVGNCYGSRSRTRGDVGKTATDRREPGEPARPCRKRLAVMPRHVGRERVTTRSDVVDG